MILDQPPLWLVLLAFLAAIGPLVFFHELGHYSVARWFGVGAETFSIGFGREIAGWTDKRGTRWKVGWLPLGGFVRFTGDMDPASMGKGLDKLSPELRARSFHAKPVWQRFLIVLAGPAANFILAVAIFAGFFAAYGVPRTPPVVGQVAVGSAAQRAGLEVGDRILAINDRAIGQFQDIADYALLRPLEPVSLAVERAGKPVTLQGRLDAVTERDRFGQEYRVGRLGISNPKPAFVR